jgi:hypothetical protein
MSSAFKDTKLLTTTRITRRLKTTSQSTYALPGLRLTTITLSSTCRWRITPLRYFTYTTRRTARSPGQTNLSGLTLTTVPFRRYGGEYKGSLSRPAARRPSVKIQALLDLWASVAG